MVKGHILMVKRHVEAGLLWLKDPGHTDDYIKNCYSLRTHVWMPM